VPILFGLTVCVREVDAHSDGMEETAKSNGTIVLLLLIFSSFFCSLDILVHFNFGVESVRFIQI